MLDTIYAERNFRSSKTPRRILEVILRHKFKLRRKYSSWSNQIKSCPVAIVRYCSPPQGPLLFEILPTKHNSNTSLLWISKLLGSVSINHLHLKAFLSVLVWSVLRILRCRFTKKEKHFFGKVFDVVYESFLKILLFDAILNILY